MDQSIRLFMTVDALGDGWRQTLGLVRRLAGEDIETMLFVLGPALDSEQAADAQAVPGLRLLETGLPLVRHAEAPEVIEEIARAVARSANVVGVDVVHVHDPALAASGRFQAPVLANCKGGVGTWWTAAHPASVVGDLPWRRHFERCGYHAAEALVAPTVAAAKNAARSYGLSRSPYVVHPGDDFEPRSATAYKAENFVLTAGDLWDSGNNLAALNRAAARLSIPVMAAGPVDGPDGESAEHGYLWTLGELGHGDLTRWLNSAPVFVSSARHLPSGGGILAAARAGAALVLSDIPSFRELWHGAARFVPADDDSALAAAIEELLGDQDRRDRLAQAARERSETYTSEAMAAGMAKIYRSLLAQDGAFVPHLEAAE